MTPLSQDIRNAYDFRSRDELERCLRLVDALVKAAASRCTLVNCNCAAYGPTGRAQPGCFFSDGPRG